MSKVAAIDLGSNTFLCLILEKTVDGGIQVLADEVRTVRLGQDLDKNKYLHPEALKRADLCLQEFRKLIDQHQVQTVSAVATSAAREAKNSEELFEICRRHQIPIDIISGKEEAQVSFAGGTFQHLQQNENILVIDIGGGSTELILGNTQSIQYAHSFDVGAVRMTERFVTAQPVSDAEAHKLVQDIEKILAPAIQQLKTFSIDRVLAVAGTPTALATIENGGRFNESEIDGMVLKRDRLLYWQKTFKETSVQQKKDQYQLGGRADIIFAGISILIWILQALNKEQIYVSTKGVRYGLGLRLLSQSSLDQGR